MFISIKCNKNSINPHLRVLPRKSITKTLSNETKSENIKLLIKNINPTTSIICTRSYSLKSLSKTTLQIIIQTLTNPIKILSSTIKISSLRKVNP